MVEEEKSVLYLGVDPKHFQTEKPLIHLPLMDIVPRAYESIEIMSVFSEILDYSHIIFTSKSAVKIFFLYFRRSGYTMELLKSKYLIAIGQVAAYYLKEEGATPTYIAADETQAGVIRVLSSLDLTDAAVLLPKSSSARASLSHFLVEHDVRHRICIMYDTYNKKPLEIPDVSEFNEVVFTTPCTVEGFFSIYHDVPSSVKYHPLGYSARDTLRKLLHQRVSHSVASV